MEWLNWLVENKETLVEVVIGVVAVASTIVGLTKKPKAIGFMEKVDGFLRRLSVLTHKDSPNTFKLPLKDEE